MGDADVEKSFTQRTPEASAGNIESRVLFNVGCWWQNVWVSYMQTGWLNQHVLTYTLQEFPEVTDCIVPHNGESPEAA